MDMKKAIIIELEEINIPKGGFVDAGWYGEARQYWHKRFGKFQVTDRRSCKAKKLNLLEKARFIKKLLRSEIYY